MPSPSKRPQRARREMRTDKIVEESSPSRPAKRRKKNDDAQTEVAEDETSSVVADQSAVAEDDGDQIVTRVTQHLAAPAQAVQASKDHANSIHESNKEGVKAYAKIAAQDWTFYITALVVNIGRTSEPAQRTPEQIEQEKSDEQACHIDLGPSKLVSRLHASIFFNSKEEQWFLSVKGRNALRVNGAPWKLSQEAPLTSGEVIEIAGIEMMFVLPTELSALHIDRQYLQRAGLAPETEDAEPSTSVRPTRHPLPSGDNHAESSPHGKGPRSQGFQKPLAPAPPDYKRPGTPPSVRARAMATHKSPLDNATGTLLMGNSDVNLGLDDNRHIKPQYSYAQMITQAIITTKEEKLNLNGIYNFIMNNYSYYRHQPASGWQNSIRHNLSLNKAFEKVPRSTDEPGKGMKWQLVAESKDDMIRQAYRGGRGGHRGSSNPSSPSQLNYITQGPRDMAARDPMTARKRKGVSPSGSPQPKTSALRDSKMTPVRPMRKPLPEEPSGGADASPLPRMVKTAQPSSLSLTETASALSDAAPLGSPTLTSSYLQEDGAFVTPAPHRVHPKLAPPSTAQRPSQHMPTSSPAPFWKYADIGSTPLKPAQDLSPSKALGNLPQSSSPPPAPSKSPAPSPTRGSRTAANDHPSPTEPEEDRGFDLTKGFQSIGSYHAPVSHGKPVKPATNGDATTNGNA